MTWAALWTTSCALGATQTFYGQDISKTLGLVNSPAAEAAFLATLSSYGTETLDSIPGFTPDPTLTFSPLGITAASNFDFVAPFPPLAVSAPNLLLDDGPPDASGDPVDDTLTLSAPVTAFGAYFVNAGDSDTANTLTLLLENTQLGTSETVTLGPLGPNWAQDNVLYFGVTTAGNPFDKITIRESFDFDGMLLDNLTVGFAVPEPSTGLLALAGAAALLLARRRR